MTGQTATVTSNKNYITLTKFIWSNLETKASQRNKPSNYKIQNDNDVVGNSPHIPSPHTLLYQGEYTYNSPVD